MKSIFSILVVLIGLSSIRAIAQSEPDMFPTDPEYQNIDASNDVKQKLSELQWQADINRQTQEVDRTLDQIYMRDSTSADTTTKIRDQQMINNYENSDDDP